MGNPVGGSQKMGNPAGRSRKVGNLVGSSRKLAGHIASAPRKQRAMNDVPSWLSPSYTVQNPHLGNSTPHN